MADKYDVFDQLGELENTLNTTLTQISGIRQVLESSMTENATLRMELEKLRDRLAEFEKKEVKKEIQSKKTKKTKEKKVKKESFFVGVRSELSKVKWPTKKDVLKYTIATLVFIIVLVIFFVLLSLLMSVIKGVFN